MGCSNTKTKDDENHQLNNENIEEDINKNEIENQEKKNENEINNKNTKKIKKIKKIEDKTNNSKINGQETNITLKENAKNYEEYIEENDDISEEKEVNEKEQKEKENKERKEFLVNLKFQNIFKEDNIDKINSSFFIDTTQKVKTTFIPSQKKLPKVIKYFDPIQGVNGPFWEINMEATKNEVMYPLWIEKNKEVIFYITGKWKINNDSECDCNGIPEQINKYEQYMTNIVKHKFNKGALLGRVIYGEQFQIYDGLRYKSDYDGPLILKMNLNSIWLKEKPSGSLNIKIKGVTYIDNIGDMEERIGWWKKLKTIQLNNLEDLPDYKIPSLEKMIIILLNKARHNSKLFACQYLDNMKNLTPNSIKIYNEFINNSNKFIPLKINVSIIKLLKNFYSPFISGNSNNNNESLIILNSSKIIKKYLDKSFNGVKNILYLTIIKYNDKNPFHLTSRLLFENKINENIFKSKCEEISMLTIQTKEGFKKNAFYTVFVLSNENGNNNINYDISKNIRNFINEEQKKKNDNNIISNIKININPMPNIFSNK